MRVNAQVNDGDVQFHAILPNQSYLSPTLTQLSLKMTFYSNKNDLIIIIRLYVFNPMK